MNRRNTVIVVALLIVLAIALLIVGTWAVIDSTNGTLHLDGGNTAAQTPTATPVDEDAARAE